MLARIKANRDLQRHFWSHTGKKSNIGQRGHLVLSDILFLTHEYKL